MSALERGGTQIKLEIDDRLKARLQLYRTRYALSQNAAIRELLHRAADLAGVPDLLDGEAAP